MEDGIPGLLRANPQLGHGVGQGEVHLNELLVKQRLRQPVESFPMSLHFRLRVMFSVNAQAPLRAVLWMTKANGSPFGIHRIVSLMQQQKEVGLEGERCG